MPPHAFTELPTNKNVAPSTIHTIVDFIVALTPPKLREIYSLQKVYLPKKNKKKKTQWVWVLDGNEEN